MTTAEFLDSKLHATQAELSSVILNRGHWDRVREDRHLLAFLQQRAEAADFSSLRRELERIAEGGVPVPHVSSPRRTAAGCLRDWAAELQAVE